MTRLAAATKDTFRSLRNPNYRRYFSGQIVSVSGTWMQTVAQSWLVLELTGSGTMLGLTTALQFLPTLLGGPWGGVIADRVDKRRLLLVTQSLMGVLATILGLVTVLGLVQLWMVLVLAAAFGCLVAIDNPTRQSFVLEMVGPDDLANAVTLNSVVMNAARVIGPATAGLLIAGVGIGPCFLFNAASYAAVMVALWRMEPAALRRRAPAVRKRGQLVEGLRYVWGTTELRVPLLVMAVIGTLTYEFQITLPLLARGTFGGDAAVYGAMTAMMGLGAVVGGIATARRSKPSPRALIRAGTAFGVVVLGVSVAPTLGATYVALLAVGATSIVFIATTNATLQLRAAPEMRGRVMSLWGVAFLGSTPLGGPIVGWLGENLGARSALAVGGVAAILACVTAHVALTRPSTDTTSAPDAATVAVEAGGVLPAGARGHR